MGAIAFIAPLVFSEPLYAQITKQFVSSFHLDASVTAKGFVKGPRARIIDPHPRQMKDIVLSKEPEAHAEEDLHFILRHDYFSLDGLAPIRGNSITPDTIGLMIELLVPVTRFFLDADILKVGFFHYSDHNIRGSLLDHALDVNAVVIKGCAFRSAHLEVWPDVYYFFKGNEFANVITSNTRINTEMFERSRDKEIMIAAGLQARASWWDVDWQTSLRSRWSADGVDAMQVRVSALAPLSLFFEHSELATRTSVGPFGQYGVNVTHRDIFGGGEFIGGFQINFSLTNPLERHIISSDLF